MIGENPKIIYKKGQEFYVSEDGLRTWRKDFHGSVKPYRAPQSHINVEIWKKSFYEIGRNRKIKNIHIWYGGN